MAARNRVARIGGGLGLWVRIVRAEPALWGAVFVLSALTTALVVTGLRQLEQASQDDLRHALSQGRPERRSVQLTTDTRIGAGGEDPFAQVTRRGRSFFDEEFSSEAKAVIGGQQFVVESAPFRVLTFPDGDDGPFTLSFRFRQQQGLDEQMTVVEGRLPERRESVPMLQGPDCPDDVWSVEGFEFSPLVDCRPINVPVYEVMLTSATAEVLMLSVGDQAILRPDGQHFRWAFTPTDLLERRMILSISGLVELTDPSDEYWYGDTSLHRPRITENADVRLVFAAGIFSPDRYRQLLRDIQATHFDYRWRYLADLDRIERPQAVTLQRDLDRLSSADGQVMTMMPDVLGQYMAQRLSTVALMSTVFTGLVVVAGLTVFVVASLAAERQRNSLRLLLERGVNRSSVWSLAAVHGLAVSVPASLAGLLAGRLAVPEGPWWQPTVAAALVALATVGAVTAAAVSTVRGVGVRLRPDDGQDPGDTGVSVARRLVRDGLVVTLGLGAVALIRRRAGGATPVNSDMDVDLLLAAAPILVTASVGVLLLRLFGALSRVLGALGSLQAGLVPFLGFRRLAGESRSTRSAVMVILLALGLAGFSTIIRISLLQAQSERVQWIVGADVVIKGFPEGRPLAPELVDAITESGNETALAVEFPSTLVLAPPVALNARVLAVDVDAYLEVLGGHRAAETIGALKSKPARPVVGQQEGDDEVAVAVPALVSRRWSGDRRPEPGDEFALRLGTQEPFTVSAVVDDFPSIADREPFVVVDRQELADRLPAMVLMPTTIFIGGPTDQASVAAIRSIVDEIDPNALLSSRHDVLTELTDDPFTLFVSQSLDRLTWFAFALAVVAVVAALSISAPARRQRLRLLLALGLRPRQRLALTLLEQSVPIVLATAAGVVVAAGLAALVIPALELQSFTGGDDDVHAVIKGSDSIVAAVAALSPLVAGALAAVVTERTTDDRTILDSEDE